MSYTLLHMLGGGYTQGCCAKTVCNIYRHTMRCGNSYTDATIGVPYPGAGEASFGESAIPSSGRCSLNSS